MRAGTEVASAIANDCVFGSLAWIPQNDGCGAEAQAVLVCAFAGCPGETAAALSESVARCARDLTEDITGSALSVTCAACYGDEMACMMTDCAGAGGTDLASPTCVQCRCESECTPSFDGCSGLPPSGDCD